MKNKTGLYIGIGVGVLVLIILLVVGFFFAVKRGTTNLIGSVSNSIKSSDNSQFNSVADLFAPSVSLECKTQEGGKEETIYLKGGAMASKSSNSNFIVNKNGMYVWEDGKKDGFIYNYTADELFKTNGSGSSINQGMVNQFAISQDFADFKKSCNTASLEDSLFVPPSNVKFQSLKDLLKQAGQDNNNLTSIDPTMLNSPDGSN